MKTNLKLALLVLIVVVVAAAGFVTLSAPSQTPTAPPVAVPPQQNAPKPAPTAFSQKKSFNFDSDQVGVIPPYLKADMTGGGTKSEWQVKNDPTAPSPPNILAQTSDEKVQVHFPLAILTSEKYKDLNVSVSFKTVSGTIDQSGGIIFRFNDAKNYYLLRASAVDNNVVLYKYVGGTSTPIASTPMTVSAGSWHTLTVVAVGESIEGYFDGKRVIEARDASFLLGSVGLRTKADSVTYFDNFSIGY